MANGTCPTCSAEFTGRKRIFCSVRCQKAAHRDGKATCSHPDCNRIVRAKGLCVTHYNITHHPDSRTLWPADPEKRRRSLRIKTQRRRALMRDPSAEPVDRDVVGERGCVEVRHMPEVGRQLDPLAKAAEPFAGPCRPAIARRRAHLRELAHEPPDLQHAAFQQRRQ